MYNLLIHKELDADGDGSGTATDTFWIYDGDQAVLEFDGDGAADVSHRYLWGLAVDQLLADETADNGGPEDILWPLTDWQGTVRHLASYNAATDTTTIANDKFYDAYGNVTSETNSTIDTLFAYTGRFFDDDTGLQWNLNRWYDSGVGTWLSPDPIGFDGLDPNLYRYVGNGPADSVDSNGLQSGSYFGSSYIDSIFARNAETVTQGLIGGHRVKGGNYRPYDTPDNPSYTFEKGGPLGVKLGGVVGGCLQEGTFRIVPAEELPSPASVFGMYVGAELTGPCSPANRLLYGTDVAKQPASRVCAGMELGIWLVPAFAEAMEARSVGRGVSCSESLFTAPSRIRTPYGLAIQENSAAALRVRSQIQQGARVYKGGVFGRSETGSSQFLTTENPLNPGYAGRYGLPPENTNFDFILSGRVRLDAPAITRSSPGIPPNPGGGIEGVVNPGDFRIDSFHMP